MGKLRDRMPAIDAFIDELREAFGREEIDRMIVTGMRDGHFHARENDTEIGAPLADDSDRAIALAKCFPWNDRREVE